jgi:hypothetical protein
MSAAEWSTLAVLLFTPTAFLIILANEMVLRRRGRLERTGRQVR